MSMVTVTITEREYEFIISSREQIKTNIEEIKNIMNKFINEIIEENKEEDSRLSYNTIWNEYKSWSKKNSYSLKPFGKQPFRGEIEKIYGKMNNTTKGWKCIKIRSV